jgi:hypothetical protein
MSQAIEPVEAAAVENILGQYIFALGTGAGGQWIQREAIQLLRAHYLPSVQKAVQKGADWGKDAVWILHYLNVIGRLAAQRSIDDGRDSIAPDHLKQAIASVEANYRDEAAPSGGEPGSLGIWCNP